MTPMKGIWRLPARSVAALRVLAAAPAPFADVTLRTTIGASPRLALGALCRRGLARYEHETGCYHITEAGTAALAAEDNVKAP